MKNNLLGKKRECRSDDEDSDYAKFSMSKEELEKYNKEKALKNNPSKEQPKDNEDIKTKEEVKSPALFSLGNNTLFSNHPNTNSIFGSSLFSNNQSNNLNFKLFNSDSSFFSNTTTQPKEGLQLKNNNEDEGDNEVEEEDDIFGNDEPKEEMVPSSTVNPSSLYNKLFAKQVKNLFVLTKKHNKFISKGNGFLSIETSKQEKKSAVLVFRNQMGTKIVEGFLNSNFNRCETYTKNFKNVAHFIIITLNKDNATEIVNIKIPFDIESEFDEFVVAFNKAIKYLGVSTTIKDKDKKNKEEEKEVKIESKPEVITDSKPEPKPEDEKSPMIILETIKILRKESN